MINTNTSLPQQLDNPMTTDTTPTKTEKQDIITLKISTKAERIATQKALQQNGYDPGPVDGIWGARSQSAYDQYLKSQQQSVPVASSGTSEKVIEDFKVALRRIYPNAMSYDIDNFAEPLLRTMAKYDINTSLRQKHFLAQVGHESGELKYKEELASGRAYEWRKDLGNTSKGDGVKYKGHGLIQLTGRANHTEYSKDVGDPEIISNPSIVATNPFYCADVAGWFWDKRGLNRYADQNKIVTLTVRINGGKNGLSDRKRLFANANKVIRSPFILS